MLSNLSHHQKEDTVQNTLTHKDFFNLFPCHTKPFPDELLSSWIYRLSHRHLTKVHTFCKKGLNDANIWNRDIDRSHSNEVIQLLAYRNGVDYDGAFKTSLRSYEGLISKKINLNGNGKWILPLGIYHRKRKRRGLQLCPGCFRKDLEPYFRKQWRLALYFSCISCKSKLIDHCPRCKEPICFHRQDVGFKNHLENSPIHFCFNCNLDFRAIEPVISSDEELCFQKMIDDALKRGSINKVSSVDFFEVLRIIATVLRSPKPRTIHIKNELNKILGNVPIHVIPKKTQIEMLGVETRTIFLVRSMWLLEEWPHRFLELNRNSRTSSSIWLTDFPNSPKWFRKAVLANLYNLR